MNDSNMTSDGTESGGMIPDIDPNHSAKIIRLQSIIRDVSLAKVGDQVRDSSFAIEDIDGKNQSILGQWMVVMIISGRSTKIVFKCHFSSKDGLSYLQERLQKTQSQESLRLCFDLLKEFCNLVGGGVKDCLGEENSLMGLSIPLITRGFDEVFFADRSIRSGKPRNRDVWSISSKHSKIICSSEIQVIDETGLRDLQDFEQNSEDDGELDFL